jgi:DNA-directed RNA polymerase specialized sigma24 family protein
LSPMCLLSAAVPIGWVIDITRTGFVPCAPVPDCQAEAMRDEWQKLLRKLDLTDERICQVARRACLARYPGRQTEELCDAVIGEVYVDLLRRLRAEPTRDIFADATNLLGYVYTVASHARGADIRERRRRVEVQFVMPEAVPDRGQPVDEREQTRSELLALLSDCPRACRECLADADEEVRRVFLLRCEGETARSVARKLGLSEATMSRLWKLVRAHFRRRCGADLADDDTGGSR